FILKKHLAAAGYHVLNIKLSCFLLFGKSDIAQALESFSNILRKLARSSPFAVFYSPPKS
ncbi:MAG: hypothetical protein AVDCRST_MAG96-1723, partial [uncultured Segetibacter sp.]